MTQLYWIRSHFIPRSMLFVPTVDDAAGGPSLHELGRKRFTLLIAQEGLSKRPVLQCDYSFISDPRTPSSEQLVLLNVHEVLTGLAMSCVVPSKGFARYAAAELRRFILETGRAFGTLQCDPEPSLIAFAEHVLSEVGGLSLRKSPTAWKQAQGAVGNAQPLLYAQIRTLRLDVEKRCSCKLELQSPLFPWLVKRAQFLLNRFALRSDGMTPSV